MTWELTRANEFANYAASWDQLNNETYQSPILESRFIDPLITHFGDGSEWLCHYTKNGRIAAMGIIKKNSFGNWSTFQPSQAPIGLWLCDPHCDLMELLTALTSKIPGFCILLSLLQLDSRLSPPPSESRKTERLDYIQTAKISTADGYERYSANRSKNLRKNLRKQHNKLAEQSLPTALRVIRTVDQISSAIAAYGELESRGWKSDTNTAIHSGNSQGHYYQQILSNFASTGHASIYQYLLGDQVAAMDLCVGNDDTLVILKTTYNESFAEYSPALLMHNEVFKDIFENTKYKNIEFYGKVMDWHKKWSDDFRDIYHLNFYKKSLLKKLHKLT